MDVEMYKEMDKIMEMMHQIASYLSEYAIAEMNGKKITKEQIEKNKILETLFTRVQKEYRELQKSISKNIEAFNTFYDAKNNIDGIVSAKMLDMQIPNSSMDSIIEDLKEYLEMSYIKLRYITYDNDEGEILSGIYKGTKCETLRNVEYDLQNANLMYLSIRNQIKNPIGEFSFKEKGYILSYMSQSKFYDDFVFKQIDKYISDFEKDSDNVDKEIYEYTRDKLIEQKYMLYFIYLNNKYNGMLQKNDTGKYAVIKNYMDEGLEQMILGMSEFEINENVKANLQESKRVFKQDIKYILDEKNVLSNRLKKVRNNSKEPENKDIKKLKSSEEEIQKKGRFEDER